MTRQPNKAKATPRKRMVRYGLDTLGGILREANRIYRAAAEGKMPMEKAKGLGWLLGIQRAILESMTLERIEAKLDQATGKAPALIDRSKASDLEVEDPGSENRPLH